MMEATMEKLKILADSAKYDVSCSSSGASRENDGQIGSAYAPGLCHTWGADGRCISLLKILFTNRCVYNCEYCVNKRSNDFPRASFEPEELARLTVEFYRRNYIEGLFLSSAVEVSPDYTAERILEALTILRYKYGFAGYIHAKIIPGVSPEILHRIGLVADRLSVNIELPSSKSLERFAPQKKPKEIFAPMRQITNSLIERNSLVGPGTMFKGQKLNTPESYLGRQVAAKTRQSTSGTGGISASETVSGDGSLGAGMDSPPAGARSAASALDLKPASPPISASASSRASADGLTSHFGPTSAAFASADGPTAHSGLTFAAPPASAPADGSTSAAPPTLASADGLASHSGPTSAAVGGLSRYGSPKKKELFAPAGQTTQMIIGAGGETDQSILTTSENLYRTFKMKRVYYSAYIPAVDSPILPDRQSAPPLAREHRIYQADWLLRFYGFSVKELFGGGHTNLDPDLDPKVTWALRNLELFPIEVNKASYQMLMRIPGIGAISAKRIVRQRKVAAVRFDDLKKMGVVVKRAKYFLTCCGRYYGERRFLPETIKHSLLQMENGLQISMFDDNWNKLEEGARQEKLAEAGVL